MDSFPASQLASLLLVLSLWGGACGILLSYPRDPRALLPCTAAHQDAFPWHCLQRKALKYPLLFHPGRNIFIIIMIVLRWNGFISCTNILGNQKVACSIALEPQHLCVQFLLLQNEKKTEGEFPAWVNPAHSQVLSTRADTRRFGEALTFS